MQWNWKYNSIWMNDEKYIILFDGVCNFCNTIVNFIIKNDKKDKFRFTALQSKQAHEIINNLKLPSQKLDTIILVQNNKLFFKSTAAIKIFKILGGIWSIFSIISIIPAFIRDFFYDLIAKNRYKVFGKRESVRIPKENEKDKFL